MSRSSRLRLSELKSPRRHSRTRILDSEPSHLASELHDVADSLHSTNRRLDNAEDLFESYQDVSRRQEEIITDLETDLDISQQQLTRERRKTKRRPAVRFVDDFLSSSDSDVTDRRRRSREHAERVASLVDRNRRAREKELESEIDALSEDFDREHEHLNRSLTERRHLSTKLGALENQLVQTERDKERALFDLEDTAVNLDKSLVGNEKLRENMVDLRSELAASNSRCLKQQSQLEELEKQFEHSRRSRHRLIDHLEKTRGHLEEAEQEREAFEEELRKSQNEQKRAWEQLEKRERQMDALEENNKRQVEMQRKVEREGLTREDNLRKKYAKALEAVKRYQRKVRDVQAELSQSRQRMKVLNQECGALGGDKESLLHDMDKSQRNLREMQQIVTDLQDDSAAKGSQVQAVKHEFHKLQSKYKDALSELSDARRFSEKLKSDLLTAKSHLSTNQRDKKELAEGLHRAKGDLNEEQGKLQDLESRYKRQLQISQSKHSELTSKLSNELARAEELRQSLSQHQRQDSTARSEITNLRRETAEAQASHEALVAELRAELERLESDGERRLHVAVKQLRDEKQEIYEELSKTKASLSDKLSIIETLQRKQERDQSKQKRLQSSIDKAMEEKEELQEKYGKLIKAYKAKTGKGSGTTGKTAEELEDELRSTRRTLQQLTADQETVLRAVASEVDSLVNQMTFDLNSSMSVMPASSAGMETDVHKWIAEMISKLKWIEHEIRLRQDREGMLKRQVTRGHHHAQELLKASEDDQRYFLSELAKQRGLLENLSRKKDAGESDTTRQRTLRKLQEQVVQLTEHLEKGAKALRSSSAALKEKQKLVDELEDRQASRKAREDIMDRYTKFRSKISDIQS